VAAVNDINRSGTSSRAFPIWFILAFLPMLVSQIIRLQQDTALAWLLCDYAGRLGTLLILFSIPQARVVAFRTQALRTSWWETTLWIIGMPLFSFTIEHWISSGINGWIPNTALGRYPEAEGGLWLFDVTVGVALVAFHEEILFRRCARAVFGPMVGDGAWMVILTSLLFAAYHWWTGLGNIAAVFIFGLYAMLFLRRTGAIWPLVVGHFLTDAIAFF
jgi:hypothetical protein